MGSRPRSIAAAKLLGQTAQTPEGLCLFILFADIIMQVRVFSFLCWFVSHLSKLSESISDFTGSRR